MTVLGIDVGAGAIKSGVFPNAGPPSFTCEEQTARTYPAFMAQVLGLTAKLRKSHRIGAVGIGIPGFIDSRERTIEISPNMLFLNGTNPEKDLAGEIGLPVRMENDANAAALGEFLSLEPAGPVPQGDGGHSARPVPQGDDGHSARPVPQGDSGHSARPVPQGDDGHSARPASFVLLTLGSGIGSGIVLDGRIWQGARGFAAELGHLLVNSRGRPCGCGNRGCAETESSGTGIVRSYQEYSGSTAALSSREVFALLQKGDGAARQAFQRAGSYLGVLLSQIVYSLNPERIAIGGGVAAAGEALLGPAREELSRRVIPKAYASTRIEPARLGNGAGMAGAAALARGRTG